MQNISQEALATGGSVCDNVQPKINWQFDEDVTDAFDNMLERSIPQYGIMRDTSAALATKYAKDGGLILDLGTSRGEALAYLVSRLAQRNRYLGLEVSEPMLKAAQRRFNHYTDAGFDIHIRKHDLREGLPDVEANIVLSILTLQFTPIEYRLKIVKDIYAKLQVGGCFVFVEKVLGSSASIDADMVDIYYQMKAKNGYSADDINRKRLSLEGVLVPLTAQWNEQLLRDAGFREIDCFWRWMNFAGWIAVK